jgi:hypothetical protein
MRRLVVQWRASGEPRAQFARRHHIPAWTFWYWCRKLSADDGGASSASRAATFVPVHVAPEGEVAIEVTLPGGERLHVRPGAPADLVHIVVAALRSAC